MLIKLLNGCNLTINTCGMTSEKLLMKHKASCIINVPYRAKLDEARPCEASDIRDARMGIRKESVNLSALFCKMNLGGSSRIEIFKGGKFCGRTF